MEVGQRDTINTMVPALPRKAHKPGFDQDIKGTTGFPTCKFFWTGFISKTHTPGWQA